MKKSTTTKKLSLNAETLRTLDASELNRIQGGGSAEGSMCQSCTYTSAAQKCSIGGICKPKMMMM